MVAERVNSQRAGAVVDGLDRLFQRAVFNDRQYRSKNFPGTQNAVLGGVKHQMRGNFAAGLVPGLAGDQLHQCGACRLRFLQGLRQALEGALVNDGGVVGGVELRVTAADNLFGGLDKFCSFALGQVDVVHGGANLTGVEQLHKHQALAGFVNVKVVTNDGG